MAHRAILVDVTKCIGCGSCVEACQQANQQPAHEAKKFDEQTFTYLMDRGKDVYVRRLCMHCEDPSCASVCPVKALAKTAGGPVTYDPKKCMGCRYCMMACPFGVPTYEWYSAMPRVRKCEMCARREGGPACAGACPTGATVTGDRDELLDTARRLVASDPKTYHQHVYGETEAGGTSVFCIGPASPADLGLPTRVGDGPLPQLTWNALKHVPDIAVYGSIFLGGMWWLTKRKEDVARTEASEKEDHHA